MDEKDEPILPSYADVASGLEPPATLLQRARLGLLSHRRRKQRLRLVGLLCLLFIGYAQWHQLKRPPPPGRGGRAAEPLAPGLLSAAKLRADLATCATLRRGKPADPPGLGRARNARYVDGQPPTLIRNASVWVGEPAEAVTPAEARAGKGYRWITADVLVERGLVQRVAPSIDAASVSIAAGAPALRIWEADGRRLTAGIIDMHSHAGVDSLPELRGNDDTNEMAADTTPYVRSKDGLTPLDHQIQVIKSGGVTTSLVLPGSANNIGGEAYVIKHAVGPRDGRPELSIASLLAAPDAPALRYIKMACGENPKRVYGRAGRAGPTSRLGESWEFRHAFEQAAALVQAQDDWCATAADAVAGAGAAGRDPVQRLQRALGGYLPRDLAQDTLAAVLRGQVYVNTHCYTIPDLEAFVDHTNEFRFPVRAFHHAHQTFLVPEVLKRAWGADNPAYGPPASALFADNMYYKAEAYVASEYAGRVLWDAGLTPVYVSDNPVLNAQHVLFEAAKAHHYGLPYHAALASVTSAPAERLGLGNRAGRVKPGFDADLVVWDSDPLSVGAAPVQVWIDGVAQFERPVELAKPVEAVEAETDAASSAPPPPTYPPAEPVDVTDEVVFTGVAKILLPGYDEQTEDAAATAPVNVAVAGGRITCVGACEAALQRAQQAQEAASSSSTPRLVALHNGYLAPAFTAFGSQLGLREIDAEADTDNGGGADGVFSRAVDGLALDTKKLHVAQRHYAVTRAISAPRQGGSGFSHFGTSAGFLTGAATPLDGAGAVFAPDAALHYTLGAAAKRGGGSQAAAVGALRQKLLRAVAASKKKPSAADAAEEDRFGEDAYLARVVAGTLPLAITAHSADTIAAVLRVKQEVEAALQETTTTTTTTTTTASAAPGRLRLVVLGGAESFLVADALAAAHVGVVLAPLLSYAESWEQRRALTGAPLTNGTAVDVLLDAGVRVAIGLPEDWVFRDLPLLAGIAYRNGGGRLTEKAAVALIAGNVYAMLGLNETAADGHFAVYEGSPLAIGSRLRAVGGGLPHVSVFA